MSEPTTLGPYLRAERERRGLTLKTISESTKVSVALLEGLEADDISRWPGGIFRRAFVRSYAQCVGLDPDDVYRRFETQYQPPPEVLPVAAGEPPAAAPITTQWAFGEIASAKAEITPGIPSQRARTLGTVADLTVALILAFASAAAGSRLLWPVLLIAAYYAVGVLLTGTSPMVALLSAEPVAMPRPTPGEPTPTSAANHSTERRLQPRRLSEEPPPSRGVQARAQ
jgi:transcriptional regulator with XRE-family HTH domain